MAEEPWALPLVITFILPLLREGEDECKCPHLPSADEGVTEGNRGPWTCYNSGPCGAFLFGG